MRDWREQQRYDRVGMVVMVIEAAACFTYMGYSIVIQMPEEEFCIGLLTIVIILLTTLMAIAGTSMTPA